MLKTDKSIQLNDTQFWGIFKWIFGGYQSFDMFKCCKEQTLHGQDYLEHYDKLQAWYFLRSSRLLKWDKPQSILSAWCQRNVLVLDSDEHQPEKQKNRQFCWSLHIIHVWFFNSSILESTWLTLVEMNNQLVSLLKCPYVYCSQNSIKSLWQIPDVTSQDTHNMFYSAKTEHALICLICCTVKSWILKKKKKWNTARSTIHYEILWTQPWVIDWCFLWETSKLVVLSLHSRLRGSYAVSS